jgi:hypothetical protein
MGRKPKLDIENKKFGKLSVVGHVGNGFWTCHCDCGNVVTKRGTALRNGSTTSCGCKQYIEETGNKYGSLTVIKRVDSMWYCSCDCGGDRIAFGNRLRDGAVTKCRVCTKKKTQYKTRDPYTLKMTPLLDLSWIYGIQYSTLLSRWHKGNRGVHLLRGASIGGNAEYRALSNKNRGGLNKIRVGELEKRLPLPPPHPDYENVGV